MSGSFEDVHEPGEIAVYIRVRIYERVANTGLSRKMHHGIESLALEQLGNGAPISQITTNEPEAVSPRETREPRFLQPDIVVGVQIVEPNHLVAAIEESLGGMESDEASRARDECFWFVCCQLPAPFAARGWLYRLRRIRPVITPVKAKRRALIPALRTNGSVGLRLLPRILLRRGRYTPGVSHALDGRLS